MHKSVCCQYFWILLLKLIAAQKELCEYLIPLRRYVLLRFANIFRTLSTPKKAMFSLPEQRLAVATQVHEISNETTPTNSFEKSVTVQGDIKGERAMPVQICEKSLCGLRSNRTKGQVQTMTRENISI